MPYRVEKYIRSTLSFVKDQYRNLYHKLFYFNYPRILCNSFQKSGTHLLLNIVDHIPGFSNYGGKAYEHYLIRCCVDNHNNNTPQTTLEQLSLCRPGEIYRGHICASQDLQAYLANSSFKHIFIYRDLRDVVVSLYSWWERHEEKFTWPYRYYQRLKTKDEKLKFLITGFTTEKRLSGFPNRVAYPDIGTRFREFLPWLQSFNCLSVRYEDLNDDKKRWGEYERIFEYIVKDGKFSTVKSEAIKAMAEGANPSLSRTFHKGYSGRWKQHLTAAHVKLFKECAGDILIELGYASDFNW